MADEKKVPADKAIDSAKGSHPVPSTASMGTHGAASPAVAGSTGPGVTDPTPKAFAKNPHIKENGKNSANVEGDKDTDPARTVAVAKWSLADLQNIYAAVRDGDYWSAFRLSLAFLNEVVNVPKNQSRLNPGMRRPRDGDRTAGEMVAVTAAQMKEIDRTIELMESQLNTSDRTLSGMTDRKVSMSGVRNATAAPQLNIGDVLAIVGMVLEFVRKWRENK